jgi:PAS domain S-box-containing protein
MNIKIRHKMIAALSVSLAIMAILGVLTFYFIRVVVVASRFTAHSQQVLLTVERVRTLTAEAQLVRSAMITDSTSLNRHEAIQAQIRKACSILDSLVSDNTAQSERVDGLKAAIAGVRLSEFPSAGHKTINEAIADIQEVENILRKERQAIMTSQFYNFIRTSVALLVLWIANMLILLLVLNRNLKARDRAESKLTAASLENKRLYENAPCGYFTVNDDGIVVKINSTLLQWLGYEAVIVADRMHILDLVHEGDKPMLKQVLLEDKSPAGALEVTLTSKHTGQIPAQINYIRTQQENGQVVCLCSVIDNTDRKKAELETHRAYTELESFSYSVSHDLRAPLRSINGYGQILMEDYASKVDDEGKRVISVIINNGKRMGQLIDDLLDFSRMSRKEISRSNINMNEFVNGIAIELLEREPGRKVDLKVCELGNTHGDPSMLRQVWVNLISNALKYSRKRKITVIEIGRAVKENETVYFIKDNGAGFSMEYYHKLFGVFQRLHKWQDFEGTGVGLAIVKRIVERHGGRIWAESKLEEGATFYYSIPEAIESRKELHKVVAA